MEKWEVRKDFNFPHFCLVGSEKVEGWKKWAHIPLLKNDTQLKQNKWQTTKKKKNTITQIYFKKQKSYLEKKKSHLKKKKNWNENKRNT